MLKVLAPSNFNTTIYALKYQPQAVHTLKLIPFSNEHYVDLDDNKFIIVLWCFMYEILQLQ